MKDVKPYTRYSCPNGKGTFSFLPETDLGYVFTVAGGVQILTETYEEGAQRANDLGCDFEVTNA